MRTLGSLKNLEHWRLTGTGRGVCSRLAGYELRRMDWGFACQDDKLELHPPSHVSLKGDEKDSAKCSFYSYPDGHSGPGLLFTS